MKEKKEKEKERENRKGKKRSLRWASAPSHPAWADARFLWPTRSLAPLVCSACILGSISDHHSELS